MDGGVAPPPVSGSTAVTSGEYLAEGWLHKRSSNHLHKDKFVKRWFMIEDTAAGPALSYCPTPEDRTLSKDPLVRSVGPALPAPCVLLVARRNRTAQPTTPLPAAVAGARALGAANLTHASDLRTDTPRSLFLSVCVCVQLLDDVLTVHEGFSDKKYSCGLDHCEFQITTADKVLLFRAMTREERDAWIENLKPILQGYLLHSMLGAQGMKPFKTMWFVLKSNKLHCFKKPDDIKVAMTSLTISSLVLRTKEEAGSTDENIMDDLDFLMYYGDDMHLIRCAHEEDRDEWIENLRGAAPASQTGRGSYAGGAAVAPMSFNSVQQGGMGGGGMNPSPRFGGLKKGARVLSRKMASATDLVDGAVHGSVKMAGGAVNMAGGIAGGAVHLAGSAAGMTHDEDDEYSSVGAGPVIPILEDGNKMVNPMTAGIGVPSPGGVPDQLGLPDDQDQGAHGHGGGGGGAIAPPPPPPLDPMGAAIGGMSSKRMANPMNAMADFIDSDDSSDSDDDGAGGRRGGVPFPGGSGGGVPLLQGAPGVGGMGESMQSMDLGESEAPSVSDAGSMSGAGGGGGGSGPGSYASDASDGGGSMGGVEHSRRQSQIDSDLLEIPYDELELDKKIGRGSFGEVYKCHWRGTTIAVKVLTDQAMNEETMAEFKTEVNMMNKVRHPNVVLLMGICSTAPHLSIITEYLPRGSMYRLLHHTQVSLEFRRRLKMAIDISKGMAYLHSATPTIVHRDLKSPNLLVDENFTVKICDFGLARVKENTFVQTINGCAGTPNWMAPEVLRNEKFTEKADVFSMGVILWEVSDRSTLH